MAGANEANSDHMGEEEREGLTDFRRLASLQRRHELAVRFADFEARHYAGVDPVDKDPKAYVHGGGAGPGRRGRIAQRGQPEGPLTAPGRLAPQHFQV